MDWIAAVPVALAGVGWLFVPGLLITYAWGLRGFAAWGLAPIASVALVATTAAVAGKLGVAWSVPLVAGVTVVVAALVGAVTLLLRRRGTPVDRRDPVRTSLTAALGLVPGMALAAAGVVRALGSPGALSQTYDSVFHYNALALILDTHNASSLTLGSLGNVGEPGTFYPGAWHDIVSLALLSTGAAIPVGANLVSAVVAVVVWPVSCVLLVRQLLGPSRAAMAVTGLVSVGFTAFPAGLLGFGVLWPNTLGMALAPAALALVLSLTGLAEQDAIGRARAWAFLPIVLLGTGFAHPNVVFSLVVLALFPVGTALLRRASRLRAEGARWRGPAELGAVAVLLLLAWYWAATTPVFADVRSLYWPPIETPSRAFGEVLLNATNGKNALWVLSVVVVVGLVLCARTAGRRWLVGAHLASGALFVIAAALNRPDTAKFTGYWYNDSYRLAAMLPITAVPATVIALLWAAAKVRAALEERRDAEAAPGWLRGLADRPLAAALPVAVALALLLTLCTKGLYQSDRSATVAAAYANPVGTVEPGPAVMVDSAELAFYQRVRDLVPQDAVVVNNPWDGSALLWALADRRTLFPHLQMVVSPQQFYLANHLRYVADDPAVCAAARTVHGQYLLVGDHRFWPWDRRTTFYPGLADPGWRLGFQLVAADGALKLYRIAACWGAQPAVVNPAN